MSDKDSIEDEASAYQTKPPRPVEAAYVSELGLHAPQTGEKTSDTDTNTAVDVVFDEVQPLETLSNLEPTPYLIGDGRDEASSAIEGRGSIETADAARLDEVPVEPMASESTRPPLLERMGVLPVGVDVLEIADVLASSESAPSVMADVVPEIVISDAPRLAQDFAVVHSDAISTLISVAAVASQTAAEKHYIVQIKVAPPQSVFEPPVTEIPAASVPAPQLQSPPEPLPEPVPFTESRQEPDFRAEPAPQTSSEKEASPTTQAWQSKPATQATPHPSWIKRAGWFAVRAAAAYAALLIALVGLFRFVDPPGSALMAIRWIGGTEIDETWVPINTISPHLVLAVVVSEDWTFCSHNGIDLEAIEQAIERAGDGIPRGASTISMQVAKNMFLWPSKSYVRKAIELPLTLTLELMWPKRRILEVYLNVAEWGPGVFGAEAAAQHHFQKSASSLTAREAAQLAASLPNPFRRDAGDPGPQTARKAGVIQARMRIAGPAASCVLIPAKGT